MPRSSRIHSKMGDRVLGPVVLAAAALLWFPADAACAQQQFYVSPTGSDNNAGTQASPWKTIAKANSMLVAGDTARPAAVEQGFNVLFGNDSGI